MSPSGPPEPPWGAEGPDRAERAAEPPDQAPPPGVPRSTDAPQPERPPVATPAVESWPEATPQVAASSAPVPVSPPETYGEVAHQPAVETEIEPGIGTNEPENLPAGALAAPPMAAASPPGTSADWLAPEPTAVAVDETVDDAESDQPVEAPQPWRGSFEAYEIGDPGRAASRCIPRQDTKFPWVPDTIADGVTIDHDDESVLLVRAASVCGSSHRHSATVRQDSYGFAVSPDNRYLVAIVADGVSSGRRSHWAAQLVTRSGPYLLADELMRRPPDAFPWRSFFERSILPHLEAETQRVRPGEEIGAREIAQVMATTVVVGIVGVAPDGNGVHPVWLTRIGDSSGWIIGADGVWRALGEVKNDGAVIAESVTSGLPFLPDDEPPVTATTVGPGEVFVLMTDGIGDPLGGGRGEVGQALAALWKTPPNPIHFAAQLDFARRTFDDDRTAVAVWPTGGD